MKADGSNLRRLTTNTVDSFNPFPSTDSKRIAYLKDTAGGREVHVMNADGSGDTLIRNFPDGVTKSVSLTGWLPDDSKLLFSRFGTAYCTAQIWGLALDGSEPFLFLDPSLIGKSEAYTLDFSSDGKRAIWTAQDGCWSPTFEIFSANFTNGAIDFTSVRQMTTNSTGEMNPHFSPDGGLFVNSRTVNPQGYGYPLNVFVTGASGETNLTPSFDEASPTDWTPGDKALVIAQERPDTVGRHIYTLTASGSLTQLTSGTNVDTDAHWLRVAPDALLQLQMCASLDLFGTVGTPYRIEFKTNLNTNWTTLTNIVLSSSPFTFVDLGSRGQPYRFYRAVQP